jgi:hypothetical protein
MESRRTDVPCGRTLFAQKAGELVIATSGDGFQTGAASASTNTMGFPHFPAAVQMAFRPRRFLRLGGGPARIW